MRNHDEELGKYFAVTNAKTVEIMLHDENNLICDISPEILANNFQYCSIHAPQYDYQHDELSRKIFSFLDELCHRYTIHNIVFHPDTVVDWSIFLDYTHLPISIENMDERKKSCQ